MSGSQRKRRSFTPEFKAQIVRLVIEEKKSISQVARAHDLLRGSVQDCVQQAKIDMGEGPADALTTSEREELQRLRRENKRLEMEREILKNRRGCRPTCWARSSDRATTRAARKERPSAFWRHIPVKKHGPRSVADLRLATP